MNANKYQEEMKRFIGHTPIKVEDSSLIMAAMGLAGEAGEFCDLVKKEIFHGKDRSKEHAIKELGDICWYLALACNELGVSLEEVFDVNIDKLSKRYSSGQFSVEEANNRRPDDI